MDGLKRTFLVNVSFIDGEYIDRLHSGYLVNLSNDIDVTDRDFVLQAIKSRISTIHWSTSKMDNLSFQCISFYRLYKEIASRPGSDSDITKINFPIQYSVSEVWI